MTIKKAKERFGIDDKTLQKLCRDSRAENIPYIEAVKINNKWIIDDNTNIIITKQQITDVLYQLLKYKNNKNATISRRCFPNDEVLYMTYKKLYSLGFVTQGLSNFTNLDQLFSMLMVTEEGFDFLFKNKSRNRIDDLPPIQIFNFNTKIGGVVS